ncbi:hypothetical protein KP509_14G077500 [Ceratopteris richardii]|uniref:Nodulin-like domain-containing protein n=2 Tax=Ceratopteris richardii TaxID=49495 RepID=A0A8T2TEH4_CERRI|nr:hypothetical protein KP509_14G077500 [Ceratopteris richardii]
MRERARGRRNCRKKKLKDNTYQKREALFLKPVMHSRDGGYSTERSTPPLRWMVLVASIWIQAFSANPYNFYSLTVKRVLNINQFQLNLLAVIKDFGEYAGILAGILFNKLPPWSLLSIGALFAFLGYGSIWLVASEKFTSAPYVMMLVAIFIGPNSASWFNTAVLVTCMRNFSHSRGLVAGFLKGFVGLSSAIYTLIFTSFLNYDPLGLLLFLAIGPPIVSLISMNFVRPINSQDMRNEEEELSKFIFVDILCIALALYLLVATILEAWVTFQSKLVPGVLTGVMLLFLVVPAFVPLSHYLEWSSAQQREAAVAESLRQPLRGQRSSRKRRYRRALQMRSRLPDIDEGDEEAFFLALAEGAITEKKGSHPHRGEDFKLRQALVKADFWLLFLVFFCGVGPGIVTLNNLAQIGEAYGITDVTMHVSFLSVFNFLGRLGAGFVSEHYVRSHALPRSVWMGIAQAVMISANLLFAYGTKSLLGLAAAIMGFCFGIQFSIMVPTASELFGLKHFGVIYNFINMSIPLVSLCFSALLAGIIYDWKAGPGNVCEGRVCFQLTFLVLTGVCVIGFLLSLILSYRIRPVYKTLYPGHSQEVHEKTNISSNQSAEASSAA